MKKISNEELGRPSPQQFAEADKMPVVVILDNVRSMHNVGSVFRTCDGFAVSKVVLCGITGTPPNREIHKTALGAEDTVPWEYVVTAAEAVRGCISNGHCVMAVEQVTGAVPLTCLCADLSRPLALVFGNEVTGVDQAVIDLCHGAIEIPQSGTKHSLNVSVSAGVVLWKLYEQWIVIPAPL